MGKIEYIKNLSLPCETCLVISMCKQRFNKSNRNKRDIAVTYFVERDIKCPTAIKFTNLTDQDGINKMRVLFGVNPI